jgi:hypothetical protein
MSDQERWLNEILGILGLPRDTADANNRRHASRLGLPSTLMKVQPLLGQPVPS